MKTGKPDRRTEKTRQSIINALGELMQEKKYSTITIQEIIDRANVGRSTFYSHFETKDELLICCIENVFEMLNQHITDCVEQGKNQSRILPVAELFEHIMENTRLFKGVMSSESTDLLFHKIQLYWNIRIEKHLNAQLSNGVQPKVPLDILANHITCSMIELLKWWMNSNTHYTPQQMDQYFQELINPCIRSAISSNDIIS